MSFGLSSQALESIKCILKKYPQIKEAKIFGSRAMGNYRESSDIDIALFGDIKENILAKVSLELDELPLLYKFDVVCFEQITHEGLAAHIMTHGKTF